MRLSQAMLLVQTTTNLESSCECLSSMLFLSKTVHSLFLQI